MYNKLIICLIEVYGILKSKYLLIISFTLVKYAVSAFEFLKIFYEGNNVNYI